MNGALVDVDGRRRSRLARRLDLCVLALVLLVFLTVAALLFPGPHPNDPMYYFHSAVNWPDVRLDYWTTRIGLLGPVVLVERLLGPGEVAVYAVPVAASAMLAAAAYGIVRTFRLDRVTAAGAALVTVLNQDYLVNSPYLFPDTVGTATFTAGMALLLYARPRPDGPSRRRADAVVVLSGVLFAATYLVREFSPVLAPTVIAVLLLYRYDLRRVGILLASVLVTGASELVYGAAKYGNAFARLDVLRGGQVETANGQWQSFRDQVDTPLEAVMILPRLLLTWQAGWALVVLMLVFLAGVVLLRDRRLTVLAVWFLNYYAVMVFFALVRNSKGDLYVNVPNGRYWYPLFPPLVIGGFMTLALAVRRVGNRRALLAAPLVAAAAATAVLVPGSVEYASCASHDIWRNEPQQRWQDVRAWLASDAAQRYDTVYSSSQAVRLLKVFSRTPIGRPLWPGAAAPIPHLGDEMPAGDGALLFMDQRFDSHARLRSLERDWVPVHVTPDGGGAFLARRAAATPVSAAERARWLAAQGRRDFTPGSCGLSPWEGV
jgi:hypothetical protein